MVEAFSMVKETCRRMIGQSWRISGQQAEWNMIPYDVQLLGAIILHNGNVSEMKTGEGKTLVATMPIYLNALTGRGVHVITVNDYLAQRDAEWMGEVYRRLGLTVGFIFNSMDNRPIVWSNDNGSHVATLQRDPRTPPSAAELSIRTASSLGRGVLSINNPPEISKYFSKFFTSITFLLIYYPHSTQHWSA